MGLPVCGQAFNCDDFLVLVLNRKRKTGESRLAIDQHRTSSALAELTAVFGSGEPEIFPQNFKQRLLNGGPDLPQLSIDLEFK